MLEHLFSQTGVRPDESLMVGDNTHDLEQARNAGTPAVAVSYGAPPREGLARHTCLAMVDSPQALRRWLAAHA
jgi:phosphoglycolate phosphatase